MTLMTLMTWELYLILPVFLPLYIDKCYVLRNRGWKCFNVYFLMMFTGLALINVFRSCSLRITIKTRRCHVIENEITLENEITPPETNYEKRNNR